MSRYIDADLLKQCLLERFNTPESVNVADLMPSWAIQEEIEDIFEIVPTADVKPVVRGEWIEVIDIGYHGWRCNLCGEDSYRKSNYCPNCGARMVEE